MEHTYKKSFIGGFLGGAIGYACGAVMDSAAASVILFFLCAYVGYDVRRASVAFAKAATASVVAVVSTVVDLIEIVPIMYRDWMGLGPWRFVWLFWTGGFFWTIYLLDGQGLQEEPLLSVPVITAFLLLSFAVGGFFTGFTYLFYDGFIKPVVAFIGRISQWPLTLLWAVIFLIGWPLFVVPWIAAHALVLMYSVRRVVTGLATVVSGTLFLWVVPFGIVGNLLGLVAIVCGIVCGVASMVAMRLVGLAPLRSRLETFVSRTFTSFVPLPVPAWVRDVKAN